MERVFTAGELRALIRESSNEFKAKLGPGVEDGNKSINDKAYKDAKKQAKEYTDDLGENVGGKRPKYEKNDFNGTTLDHQPENADDNYRKRVKAQALGYTSEAEMNNGNERTGDFEGNKAIYDGIKASGKEMHKEKEDNCKVGLVGRERPEGYFKKEEMYESNNKMKTVRFKKTEFLSESLMMQRIPDEFKTQGNVFRMVDKNENEYVVEWNGKKGVVLEHKNANGFNNSIDRMKALMGYKSSDSYSNSTPAQRLNENEESVKSMLDRIRELSK